MVEPEPSEPTLAEEEPRTGDRAALAQFLRWLTPLIFGFAGIELIAGFVIGDRDTVLVGACILAYGVCLLWARRLLARDAVLRSAIVVSAGLIVPDILILLLEPAMFPTLAFVPLVAVAVTLPFVDRRSIWPLFAAAWVWSVLVIVLGELLPRPADVAPGYSAAFRIASAATSVAMLLLLLAQVWMRLAASAAREREAAEQLRELDEMRTTFLHAVSHDLRGPVTAILGSAGTLERFDPSPADRDAFISSIKRNADKLRRLLNDLLDFDRMDKGILPLDLQPVDLRELVAATIEAADLPVDRSVTVDIQPVEVVVDAIKVERILENLLTNAVRHTGTDVPIWVRASPADGGVLLVVEDAGPGVAPEDRAALFEPFRQGLDAATRGAGAGIGLSLVARFAEMHGGRAWVEDRAGGGASFKVFLPNAGQAAASQATARPA